MKFIIEHHKEGGEKRITKNFEIIELMEEQLPDVQKHTKYIEMNFEMHVGNSQFEFCKALEKQPVLFVTLGEKQQNERVDAFYNMTTQQVEKKAHERSLAQTYWLSCYVEDNKLNADCYIHCICQLVKWAKLFKKPLIIYSELVPCQVYYKYRSLTSKIVNSLLKQVIGVLVIPCERDEIPNYYTASHKSCEFYVDETIYLNYPYKEGIERLMKCLEEKSVHFKNIYRVQRASQLYDDLFYNLIPHNEKIYVPLNIGVNIATTYFENLGLKVIRDMNNQGVLYGLKSIFDKNREALQMLVFPSYTLPILERGDFTNRVQKNKRPYKVIQEEIPYKGNGIYIAIVSNSSVDYTASYLRRSDGTSRIAGIWQQTEANEGQFYTNAQINEALQSDAPSSIVPIGEDAETNTMLLAIAGGKEDSYEGVAVEAEFLIAKVNTASTVLQQLYSGTPNVQNILMPDLLIGIWQLQRFAQIQGKPIIFYLPHYTNIDGHDGLGFYNVLLANTATLSGCAMIAPTGEEGDKRHHQTLYNNAESTPIVTLQNSGENENILGLVTQHYLARWQVFLESPSGEKIDITRPGTFTTKESTIYSQGEKVKFYNGSKEILFRIENMQKGAWQLEVVLNNSGYNRVDLWISGEKSNPQVQLLPQNPYVTIGSIGNIEEVISIVGYDVVNMVTLKASGRGYTIDHRLHPAMAANGILETRDEMGQQVEVTGTEVSSILMVGVAATIFEKWREERGLPFLNGPLLNSMLLEYVTRVENVVFPNPNQGQGIFKQETLRRLLMTPFN